MIKPIFMTALLGMSMTSHATIRFVDDDSSKNHVNINNSSSHLEMTVPHEDMEVQVQTINSSHLTVEFPNNQKMNKQNDNLFQIQQDTVHIPTSPSSHRIPLRDQRMIIKNKQPLSMTFLMAP